MMRSKSYLTALPWTSPHLSHRGRALTTLFAPGPGQCLTPTKSADMADALKWFQDIWIGNFTTPILIYSSILLLAFDEKISTYQSFSMLRRFSVRTHDTRLSTTYVLYALSSFFYKSAEVEDLGSGTRYTPALNQSLRRPHDPATGCSALSYLKSINTGV